MKLSKLELKVNRNGELLIINEDTPYDKPDYAVNKCFGCSDMAFVYYPTGEKEVYKEKLINFCIDKAQKEISRNTTIIEKLMKERECE